MSSDSHDFGRVVLVRFPFTNQVGYKQRPAVVVSHRDYNAARADVVIMAVTSRLHDLPDFGEVRATGWQAANLLKPSAIKPVFATLEQGLILKVLGDLQTADQTALRQSIAAILT